MANPSLETDPNARYWAAAAAGQLLYCACRNCSWGSPYVKDYCPQCASRDVEWRPSAGRGSVYSFSVVHRAPTPEAKAKSPYVMALVDLAEGHRRLSWIVDCSPEQVYCGMPVQVVFREQGGLTAPFFAPVSPAAEGGQA